MHIPGTWVLTVCVHVPDTQVLIACLCVNVSVSARVCPEHRFSARACTHPGAPSQSPSAPPCPGVWTAQHGQGVRRLGVTHVRVLGRAVACVRACRGMCWALCVLCCTSVCSQTRSPTSQPRLQGPWARGACCQLPGEGGAGTGGSTGAGVSAQGRRAVRGFALPGGLQGVSLTPLSLTPPQAKAPRRCSRGTS